MVLVDRFLETNPDPWVSTTGRNEKFKLQLRRTQVLTWERAECFVKNNISLGL